VIRTGRTERILSHGRIRSHLSKSGNASPADGHGERDAALLMIQDTPGASHRRGRQGLWWGASDWGAMGPPAERGRLCV